MRTVLPLSTAILVLLTVTAFASTNGGMGGAFGRVGAGARALGMGNAFTGLAEGSSAIYFNPAAISFGEKREFVATTSRMALDRRLDYIAFSAPVHPKTEGKVVNAGIGLGWLHAGVGDIDSRDFDGNPLEMIDMSSNLFLFSFGVQLHEKVGAGITAKVIYETFGKIGDEGASINGDGFGVDAAIFAKPINHLQVGAQVKDIGSKTTWNSTNYWSQGSSKIDNWPKQFRVGAAYDYEFLTAALDVETSAESETKLHAGLEAARDITDKQSIAGRVGLDGENFNAGIGLGFMFWKLDSMLDFTYTLESIAPDDAITVSWGVAF